MQDILKREADVKREAASFDLGDDGFEFVSRKRVKHQPSRNDEVIVLD